MATNKEKLLKGLNFMFLCFPFATFGPILFFWKGAQALQNGSYWLPAICLIIMLCAIYFFIKGLRMVLNGFFD